MRLFCSSKLRNTKNLSGLWDFVIDTDRVGYLEKWYDLFPVKKETMCVPFCWNCVPEYFKYEGLAWYQTVFEATSDTYLLTFENVLNEAEVYVDGICVKHHYGGFLGFQVEGSGKGKHILTVAVDNTHNEKNTIPLSRVDWFHYGGIAGNVYLDCFEECYISDHRIDYELTGNRALGNVEFNITGEYIGKVQIYLGEELVAETDAHSGKNNLKVDFGCIERWDIFKPNLYLVEIRIEGDSVVERIGFREIEVKGKQILLNGREIKIKGINRHNEHPDFGFAVPFSMMKKDVDIIKNMGVNLIRGSHYPNPPELLDYLDEIGMLFWEEIPMWGFYDKKSLGEPLTMERGIQMHDEMIRRDCHHPSIVFWGLHNEIGTDIEEGYEITKNFYEVVRALDRSRPITFASLKVESDVCLEFADIVSMNIYPGWYGGHDPKKESEEIRNKIQSHLERVGSHNKPFIISEFGAGAVFGEHSLYNAKWTEEYQSELLRELITAFEEDENVNGMIIWQYCDIRSSFELELTRPRSYNNKGLVNEYRQPKTAFYTVSRLFNKMDVNQEGDYDENI